MILSTTIAAPVASVGAVITGAAAFSADGGAGGAAGQFGHVEYMIHYEASRVITFSFFPSLPHRLEKRINGRGQVGIFRGTLHYGSTMAQIKWHYGQSFRLISLVEFGQYILISSHVGLQPPPHRPNPLSFSLLPDFLPCLTQPACGRLLGGLEGLHLCSVHGW